jgi:transcriptional regulator
MFRKDLIELLLNRPSRLYDIARELDMEARDLEQDVTHLLKSLKHTDYRLIIHPAHCRKCGFEFSTDHLHKPGKCPKCRGTWISEPLFEVAKK